MAKIITIPKEIARKGDLVLISRKEYERLLSIFKIIPKEQVWFWTKEWQKREKEVEEDIRVGKIYGPFSSGKELIQSLKSKR